MPKKRSMTLRCGVSEQPALAEVLRQTPAEKMADLLATEQAPGECRMKNWQSWRSAFTPISTNMGIRSTTWTLSILFRPMSQPPSLKSSSFICKEKGQTLIGVSRRQ